MTPTLPDPRNADIVVHVGGELLPRDDDQEETIGQRLDVYREQTEPVVSFYEKRGRLKTVEAEGEIDEVYQRLVAAIDG